MHGLVHKSSRFEKKRIEREYSRGRTLSQNNVLELLTADSKLKIVNHELAPKVKNDGTVTRGRKDKRVAKHERPKSYNIMQDLIWNYRSGELDDEFKEKVVQEVYKYDCRIDAGEKYKIKMVTDQLRQQSRESNWEKVRARTKL